MIHHICLSIEGGIKNAKQLINCIEENGQKLETEADEFLAELKGGKQ